MRGRGRDGLGEVGEGDMEKREGIVGYEGRERIGGERERFGVDLVGVRSRWPLGLFCLLRWGRCSLECCHDVWTEPPQAECWQETWPLHGLSACIPQAKDFSFFNNFCYLLRYRCSLLDEKV